MFGIVSRASYSPHAALREAITVSGGSLLLGVVIATAAFTLPAETRGQTGKTPAKGKPVAVPADFYGDQGGEKTSPANAKLPIRSCEHVPRTPLSSSATLALARPSAGKKQKALLIDYEMASKGRFNGAHLSFVRKTAAEPVSELSSINVDKDSGVIQLRGTRPRKGRRPRHSLRISSSMLIRTDNRYDTPLKTMVSNSVVMGKMRVSTSPRDWTPEEFAKWGKEPPAYRNPNAFPSIGEDVPPLPNGPNPRRYVDPEGSLLGLDFSNGEWAKRMRIGKVAPVYSATQPKQYQTRSIAKKGYVVAGRRGEP